MLYGNRLTDNTLSADDGRELIARAIAQVASETGWRLRDQAPLFRGIYYDSAKVGSFIARAVNDKGEFAVLKIQLRPLDYDEGMILRHIRPQIHTPRIRLPQLIADKAWSETRGYGYLIMEDVGDIPRLWAGHSPTDEELRKHEDFLREFMHHVLPIKSFLPKPNVSVREKYIEALGHFESIAQASRFQHADREEVERMKTAYIEALHRTDLGEPHFTHGHLSGMDISIDPASGAFVLFSNLMWSYRPKYYEGIFPFWADTMGIRNPGVTGEDILVRADTWAGVLGRVTGENPRETALFRFLILERAMMTVMLDLGASEWSEEEARAKQALLLAWKDAFWKELNSL